MKKSKNYKPTKYIYINLQPSRSLWKNSINKKRKPKRRNLKQKSIKRRNRSKNWKIRRKEDEVKENRRIISTFANFVKLNMNFLHPIVFIVTEKL